MLHYAARLRSADQPAEQQHAAGAGTVAARHALMACRIPGRCATVASRQEAGRMVEAVRKSMCDALSRTQIGEYIVYADRRRGASPPVVTYKSLAN